MVYQTTAGIDPRIRKSGCYFLAVLRIVESLTGKDLTVDQVNKVFGICERTGYIGADGWMKEDAGKGVAQVASGLTRNHAHVRRVFENQDHNFLIGKYHLGDNSHFILMQGIHNEEYDPWSANGSNTVKNGKFHSPRYYFGEAI